MLMADTMAIFFVILGLMLALPGLWLLCRGLWPNLVSGSSAACSRGLGKSFLIGLPVSGISVILAVILSRTLGSIGQILAVALVCALMIYSSTGVSGLATVIGHRLPSPVDADRPWRATLRGGIVLELSYLLPILGWFVILPVSLVIGAGSVTQALFKFRKLEATGVASEPLERAATNPTA
jgi:hypothetical protein